MVTTVMMMMIMMIPGWLPCAFLLLFYAFFRGLFHVKNIHVYSARDGHVGARWGGSQRALFTQPTAPFISLLLFRHLVY
jgi:hypothetical protein